MTITSDQKQNVQDGIKKLDKNWFDLFRFNKFVNIHVKSKLFLNFPAQAGTQTVPCFWQETLIFAL